MGIRIFILFSFLGLNGLLHAQHYRFERPVDTNHQAIFDAIIEHDYQHALFLQNKFQLGTSIPVLEWRRSGGSSGGSNYSTKPLAMLFNILNPDFYISQFRKSSPGYKYLDTAQVPLSAFALVKSSKFCRNDNDSIEFACQLDNREKLNDFVLYQMKMDKDFDTPLADLINIYERAERTGFTDVMEYIRLYPSVVLLNEMYLKYDHVNKETVESADSLSMLEIFSPTDKESVGVSATDFVYWTNRAAWRTTSSNDTYVTEFSDINIFSDSLPLYNAQLVGAILRNDSTEVLSLFKKGCHLDMGGTYYSSKIRFAWELGNHDLADYMSNLQYPDNAYGGTSYLDQGLKNRKPLPSYNLLNKIDVQIAPAVFNSEIPGYRIRFDEFDQKQVVEYGYYSDSLNAFIIPISKSQMRNKHASLGYSISFILENKSKRKMYLKRYPDYSDGISAFLSSDYMSRLNEDKQSRQYLNVSFKGGSKETEQREKVEVYLKDVDKPFVINIIFVQSKIKRKKG